MAQNKSAIDTKPQNKEAVDQKPQNKSALDQKPQNSAFSLPIETEQQYTVSYGAGQWMGMYTFTYVDGGTITSPKSP